MIEFIRQQTGVAFLDFTADPRFSGEDFHDAHHLSEPGARKFTAILDAALPLASTSIR